MHGSQGVLSIGPPLLRCPGLQALSSEYAGGYGGYGRRGAYGGYGGSLQKAQPPPSGLATQSLSEAQVLSKPSPFSLSDKNSYAVNRGTPCTEHLRCNAAESEQHAALQICTSILRGMRRASLIPAPNLRKQHCRSGVRRSCLLLLCLCRAQEINAQYLQHPTNSELYALIAWGSMCTQGRKPTWLPALCRWPAQTAGIFCSWGRAGSAPCPAGAAPGRSPWHAWTPSWACPSQ